LYNTFNWKKAISGFLFAAVIFLIIISCNNLLAKSHSTYSPPILLIRFYKEYMSDLRYGNCRFQPSCSNYACESINYHGYFNGIINSADRLVRCNNSAYKYYPITEEGKLRDPPRDICIIKYNLAIPAWLFFNESDPLFAISSNTENSNNLKRITESAQFADYLADNLNCNAAATEYMRVAFMAGNTKALWWARMKTGFSLGKSGRWEDASEKFLLAADQSTEMTRAESAYYMAAVSLSNIGNYEIGIKVIKRNLGTYLSSIANDSGSGNGYSGPGSFNRDNNDFRPLSEKEVISLCGIDYMATGQWARSIQCFDYLKERYHLNSYGRRAEILSSKARMGTSLPHRNKHAASLLSILIPGAGQIYSGRYYDGVRHFIFNALLGYSTYRIIESGHYAGGYLMAGITLPFYLGNISGAGRSAEQFNRTVRTEYVIESLNEAL